MCLVIQLHEEPKELLVLDSIADVCDLD